MIAEIFLDYFLIATLLMAVAIVLLLRLRDPARRVLVVRSIFIAMLILPMLLFLPGLPRFAWRTSRASLETPQNRVLSQPFVPQNENVSPPNTLSQEEQTQRLQFTKLAANMAKQSQANELDTMAGDSSTDLVPQPPEENSAVANVLPVANTTQPSDAETPLLAGVTSVSANPRQSTVVENSAAPKGQLLLRALFVAQCVGMFLVACWQGLGFLFATRFLRGATPVDGEMLGQSCRVMTHAKLNSPAILGLFRPTILLPDISDEREKQLALAHEWAHFENGDLTALAVERVVMFLLCLHPMFWWLRARVRGDQEILADLKAAELSDRTHYAEQLLAWAKRAVQQPVFAGTSMLGIVEFSGKKSPQRKTLLTRRITMLLDENVRLTKISRMGKLVTLLVAAVVTVLFSMQTLRPQVHLAVANAPQEQTVIEETQEKPEKSDSLYSRWNALLNSEFHRSFLSYDPQKVIDLYRQEGFEAVQEYIKSNNPPQHVAATLDAAIRTISDQLMSEEKYDEVTMLMQNLPEKDRDFGQLFAGYFFSHKFTKENLEKIYAVYRQLAGDEAPLGNFVNACVIIPSDDEPLLGDFANAGVTYQGKHGINTAYSAIRSLENAELRAGCYAVLLTHSGSDWSAARLEHMLTDWTEADQVEMARAFLEDSKHLQDTDLKAQGSKMALNSLSKAGKANEEYYREALKTCVGESLMQMDESNSGWMSFDLGNKSPIQLALGDGQVDIVVEHVMASPSLQRRNASLYNVMSHFGSTDTNWKGDISTWGSLDSLMDVAYIEPIRPVKSAYARMLLVDREMMNQMEGPGAICVVFCDEIRKSEYLDAARAADDAFVKGESLAVIAASNALAKNPDQARVLVDEAIEQLANIEDATRQNYLKTQIARVYAFLKDGDKFREWDAEIRGDMTAKNNHDTLSQLQFYAAFAGLKELSNEIFAQLLVAITEGVAIPDDPYNYQQMTEEQKTYQTACYQLDDLFYRADNSRDKERMLTVFEAMEAFEVPHRDNHFGKLYKIDPDFAVQKMKEWAVDMGQNRKGGHYINGYVFFEQNLEQYVPKRVVIEIFEVYLDSVVIEKPEHFHNFFGVIGAGFGSDNTLFEKYSVDLSRAKSIFEAAEKLLPEDGDSVLLHESPMILFIAKYYQEMGEQEKAVELIEGWIDYVNTFYEKGTPLRAYPLDQVIPLAANACFKMTLAWNIRETNPALFEKVVQFRDRVIQQTNTQRPISVSAEFGEINVTTEDFEINPDGSIDVNVNLNDTGNRYEAFKKAVQLVLDAGENATDEQIRACIDLVVDENDTVEMGDPMKDQAPFVNVLATHKNPENLKYLVEVMMKTFEKCRETQNGNGQLQAAANLCIVMAIIELHDIEDEYYTSINAKLRESLPEDMRMMFRFMGVCMAKRFDLAREMIPTFPEEMQAMAQEALEDWSQDVESKE